MDITTRVTSSGERRAAGEGFPGELLGAEGITAHVGAEAWPPDQAMVVQVVISNGASCWLQATAAALCACRSGHVRGRCLSAPGDSHSMTVEQVELEKMRIKYTLPKNRFTTV